MGDEFMKVWRSGGCENFVGKVSERSLYSMRSVIFTQWTKRKMGMI